MSPNEVPVLWSKKANFRVKGHLISKHPHIYFEFKAPSLTFVTHAHASIFGIANPCWWVKGQSKRSCNSMGQLHIRIILAGVWTSRRRRIPFWGFGRLAVFLWFHILFHTATWLFVFLVSLIWATHGQSWTAQKIAVGRYYWSTCSPWIKCAMRDQNELARPKKTTVSRSCFSTKLKELACLFDSYHSHPLPRHRKQYHKSWLCIFALCLLSASKFRKYYWLHKLYSFFTFNLGPHSSAVWKALSSSPGKHRIDSQHGPPKTHFYKYSY